MEGQAVDQVGQLLVAPFGLGFPLLALLVVDGSGGREPCDPLGIVSLPPVLFGHEVRVHALAVLMPPVKHVLVGGLSVLESGLSLLLGGQSA